MTGNVILMTMISKIESEQFYVSIVYNKGQSENDLKAYYHMPFNPIEYNLSYSSHPFSCIASFTESIPFLHSVQNNVPIWPKFWFYDN